MTRIRSKSMSVEQKNTLSHDSILWSRLIKGDRDALDQIFLSLYEDLFLYGVKISHNEIRTKDAIQDVFLTLWESKKKLENIQNPKSYIFRSFRNRLLYLTKQSSFRKLTIDKYAHEKDSFVFSAEDFIISGELSHDQHSFLIKILNQLSERQREVVFLKFYGNHSNSEISEIMNMKKQSVANLLARTIQILRDASDHTPELLTIANLYIISRL